MSKKKTDRASRMPVEEFVPLYLDAVASGMTREEFAAKLGVLPNSVYQRIYDMHAEGACKKTFPQLPLASRKSFAERVAAAVEQYRSGAPAPKRVGKKGKPPEDAGPAIGSDGDLDPTAELERLLNS